jgi:amino acid adenylation domain-containing protein
MAVNAAIDWEEEVIALPVSFAQQRLWFLNQLDPGSPVYNIPAAIHIEGELDVKVLEQSFNALIERHEILRTTFAVVDDEPVQVVSSAQPFTLPLEDLQHYPSSEQKAVVQQRMYLASTRPFNLQQGPLLSARLFRLAEKKHILFLNIHHIIADGWSIGILWHELGVLYTSLLTGGPSPLSDLPIQYADYAVWQRKWLTGERLARLTEYWRRQLAGAPVSLDLPTDWVRPPTQTFRGSLYNFSLPSALVTQLEALSAREGVTLFMTLLAVYQTLLYRYSGQDDVLVGTPVAGRTRSRVEDLIGFFVNILALRGDLAGNPCFSEVLRRTREVCLGAYAHQDMPFEKLVDELQVPRNPGLSPLVQVVLALQNTPMPPIEFAGLTLHPIRIDNGTAKFDLMLNLQQSDQGLLGTVEYNTDLFEEATIGRMMAHLQMLLEGIVANPEQRIDDLPLLTEREREQVVAEWNDTTAVYPREGCVHELIEVQAARTPDVAAVVFEGKQLTYKELNQQANQLAHYLRHLGVGPDVPVALCLKRSLEMLIGILGVLKAGGAYVPLDPSYPAERLRYMLEDCGAPVLLMQRELESQAHFMEKQCKIVYLDADRDEIARQSEANLPRKVLGDNLAYIIYTSGSTGRPKGVMVRQRGLLNLCFGLRAFFEDLSVQNVALITSISFDISVNQIFPALIFGRTLHIISEAVKYDGRMLMEYVINRHIHLLDAVPSYLNAVLTDLQTERVTCALRYILVGGEKLERWLLDKAFRQLGKEVVIVNVYGLTEITDLNSLAILANGDTKGPVTIGRPLPNNRLYILNRRNQLQPPGVMGEVCIAGESLSRGYWRRPDLTAEKFVPCPFGEGEVMCRTGDIGRWLPDGTIELLGRADHQVKVRGFRIELGEIEQLLDRHPGVRESVAIVREDRPGDQRLVAYVVPLPGEKLSSREVRQYLQILLPGYMVPAVVVLAELPHTPNGKVDRKALPVPGSTEVEALSVAPRTSTEMALAAIWKELLGVSQVGIEDSFFDLGGHSLLVTRMAAQIHRNVGVEIPLRRLFETPTIGELAHYIETVRQLGAASHISQTAATFEDEEGII